MASNITTTSQVPHKKEFRQPLSFLSVLRANELETEHIDQEVVLKTASDFYKGAPPTWLAFALDNSSTAQRESMGIVPRKGYEKLIDLIKRQQQGNWSVNTVKLYHQPGSGGSTLAMQALWSLRKELRCAVLIDPFSDKKVTGKQVPKDPLLDTKTIAKQVIDLFTGGQSNMNTVLLLQDNEHMKVPLKECIIKEMAEQKLRAEIPVVIILQCTRTRCITNKDADEQTKHAVVTLETNLFDQEKDNLLNRQIQMQSIFGESFSIILLTFNDVRSDEIIKFIQQNKTARVTKLFAIMSLLNVYVPGSYLLLSECESFLGKKAVSFKAAMQPFIDLIVTFFGSGEQLQRVRMAHPVIADQCVQLLSDAGVEKSKATLDFLRFLSKKQLQPSLLQFLRDMLTKREATAEGQEKFSKLIMDIEATEGKAECLKVLKKASETFKHDPFYPQSLARFFYIKMSDFDSAAEWAKKAIEREPTNSFVADTLGQVYKNHLIKTCWAKEPANKILGLAEKAIKAFKEEEVLAENESTYKAKGSKYHMNFMFNNRGMFGYIQVANTVYDALCTTDRKWEGILKQEKTSEHISALLTERQLTDHKSFICSLKWDVEKRFYSYFEPYLIYSRPCNKKDEPSYVRRDITECHFKYTCASTSYLRKSTPLQTLKNKMASTFPGVLLCHSHNPRQPDLYTITDLWNGIYKENPSDITVACIYVLAKMMSSQRDATLTDLRVPLQTFLNEETSELRNPEFYLVVMLLFWPEEKTRQVENNSIDLNTYIGHMKRAYQKKYEKYLQSRELVPLFYLGWGAGVKRFVYKSIRGVFEDEEERHFGESSEDAGNGGFEDLPKPYLRLRGVVREHKAFACVADNEIAVSPQHQASVWKDGNISFNLYFTISGPVAFRIKYEHTQGGMVRSGVSLQKTQQSDETTLESTQLSCEACNDVEDPKHWEGQKPTVQFVDGVKIYRHMTAPGCYECIASGLRWVCSSDIQLQYHFSNWEPQRDFLSGMRYEPAGPLMNITMDSGQLDEVHLPHFACLGGVCSFRDEMKVLHGEEDGASLENVDEVTRFHAKLLRPTFSPKGVLVRSGFPFKVHCDLMVYLSKTDYLSLRIYLFPSDPALVEAVKNQESDQGLKQILVPRPEKSLKTKKWYKLQANCQASIEPEVIKLRYVRTTPSFFKVHIQDSEQISVLKMGLVCDEELVWERSLRKAELRDASGSNASASSVAEPHGRLKEHWEDLINNATHVVTVQIADALLSNSLSQEEYNTVLAADTPENKMRKLLGLVINKGAEVEIAFFTAFQRYDPHRYRSLVSKES